MEGPMSWEEPGFGELESWLYLQMPNNAIVSEITSERNQIQGIARVFSPLNLEVRPQPQGQPAVSLRETWGRGRQLSCA